MTGIPNSALAMVILHGWPQIVVSLQTRKRMFVVIEWGASRGGGEATGGADHCVPV